MRRVRWLYTLPLCIFLSTIGVMAWVFAHSMYPHTVYYERLTITGANIVGNPEQAELWVDPQRNQELRITNEGAYRYNTLIDQNGTHERSFRDGTIFEDDVIPTDIAASLIRDWRQLQQGGFRGLAEFRLAHAVGPIAHVQLNGHAALRFDTSQHDRETLRLTAWIDARTHEPLQLKVDTADYSYIQRVDSMRRLPPGTLAADFFTPPRTHTSYWDQALEWLRAKVGLHH